MKRFLLFTVVIPALWICKAHAQDQSAQAQKWWEDSVAQSKKGHLIAMVATGKEQSAVLFRFDSFPGVERVVTGDGTAFARPSGKDWHASSDWGKSGKPATKKQSAELEAVVDLALRAFQPIAPDPKEGAVVWKPAKQEANSVDSRFVQSREKPRPGKDAYPTMAFVEFKGEEPATLLRGVLASWPWKGSTLPVSVGYYYSPQETAPPEGPMPEDLVAQAMRAAKAGPVKVDATMMGYEDNDTRVAGIIAGNDFDLTAELDGKSTRQIALGANVWASEDGGKTWKKRKQADRKYFNVLFPTDKDDIRVSPLSLPLGAVDDGTGDGGVTVRRFGMRTPGDADDMNIVTYWVEIPVLTTLVVRRLFTGARDVAMVFATFEQPADGKGVLPPPGNPSAPGDSAQELLKKAVKAMQGLDVALRGKHPTCPHLGGNP